MDEAELIEQLRSRNQTALNVLYEQYSGIVYALALRILGQTAEAEDVVIDCFWQIWQQAANYDSSRGQLRAWIVTIGRSRALDRLRLLRRSPLADSQELGVMQENPATDNPEQETWLTEQSSIIRSALMVLPREQRIALELAYYQGLSQTEVAECLGEPLGTIKTRIRLGMIKLREQLSFLRGK